jgi:hypothetical protein
MIVNGLDAPEATAGEYRGVFPAAKDNGSAAAGVGTSAAATRDAPLVIRAAKRIKATGITTSTAAMLGRVRFMLIFIGDTY